MKSVLLSLFMAQCAAAAQPCILDFEPPPQDDCETAPPPKKIISQHILNPQTYHVPECYKHFYANAEFLYWVAETNGLAFIQTNVGGTTTLPSDGVVDFNGELLRVKPKWDPGFRFALGAHLPGDGYDTKLEWTHYFSHTWSEVTSPNLLTIWGHPNSASADQALFAEARWDVHYDTLDWVFGRGYWIGDRFPVRPFLGLRGAWINQQFHVHNQYNALTSMNPTGQLKMLSIFQGIGPIGGVQGMFDLGPHWKISGSGSGGLIYSRFNCDFRENQGTITVASTVNHFNQSVPFITLAMGVDWEDHFASDQFILNAYLGWEQTIWFGANRMLHFFHDLGDGKVYQENNNLTFQGITFRLGVDL